MDMRIDDRVTITVENMVAEVRLSRPEKLNAVDLRMFDALGTAAKWVEARSDVRVVVLSGEGRSFCSGLDMTFADDLASADGKTRIATRSHGDANIFQRAALAWHDLGVPVIAALHGVAFGAGLQIALGADLRFCAPDARLSLMETRWSLVPDMAAFLLLPGLVREDVARDLVFSARVIEGEEAFGLGLVTRVCADPQDSAARYARELAARSPRALAAAKRLLNGATASRRMQVLSREAEEQIRLLEHEDHRTALQAHRERLAPVFRH